MWSALHCACVQGTEPEDAQREYMDIILGWPGFGSSVHPVKVG